MKKFSRLNRSSYSALVVLICLLSFLGLTIYLVSSGPDKEKQEQSVNKILPDKIYEAKDVNTVPNISIVVIGLGLDKSLFEKVMNLPKQVTLGFSPYSPYLDYIFELTQKRGRDIIINIPMETLLTGASDYSFQDNGPYALISDLGNVENSERLDFVISKGRGFNGYYTSIYDSFTDGVEDLAFLLNKIKETKKYIVYNDPRKVKPFATIASELGMQDKIIRADILIDSKLEKSEIKSELDELKNITDAYGCAIGIARAYHISVNQVDKWLKTVDKEAKYNVIPLSEFINKCS